MTCPVFRKCRSASSPTRSSTAPASRSSSTTSTSARRRASRVRAAARGVLLRAAVVLAPLCLAACPKAGAPKGPAFEAPGAFRMGLPPAGWDLKRNQRWGSRYLVDWKRHGEDIDIRVTSSPISQDEHNVPLLTLAEALMQNYGRARGIHTNITTIQRADFGAHEGVVVYATRTANLVQRQLAQVFVRAGRHLVMISYVAPPETYATYAPDFAFAIERFAVLLPADAPTMGVTLPSDLPTAATTPAAPP